MSELHAVPKPGRAKRVRRPMKKSRMKSYNAKRKGHKFPKRRDPDYCAWIRVQPCELARRFCLVTAPAYGNYHDCIGPVQVCHVKTRGAGGDDVGNVVPMCAGAHDEQHRIGIRAFQKRWGIDLAKIAAGLAPKYTEGW